MNVDNTKLLIKNFNYKMKNQQKGTLIHNIEFKIYNLIKDLNIDVLIGKFEKMSILMA